MRVSIGMLAVLLAGICSADAPPVTGTTGADLFDMVGESVQLEMILVNPYDGLSVAIDDMFNVNCTTYDGLGGWDSVQATNSRDYIASKVDGVPTFVNVEQIALGDGDDIVILADPTLVTNAPRIISGGNGHDIIWTGAGDEFIAGNTGDDLLHGGPGKDSLFGEPGDDELHGGDGDDELVGGSGENRLFGGAGSDTALYQSANLCSYSILRVGVDELQIVSAGSIDHLYGVEFAEFTGSADLVDLGLIAVGEGFCCAADDGDSDGVCDFVDNCPTDANTLQEDLDGDGVGDSCDNCPSGPNPDQGAAIFGQTVVAQDGDTFGWPTAADVAVVQGDLGGVSIYAFDFMTSVGIATSYTDLLVPGGGAGFYYLFKPGCAVGSWQSTLGNEAGRDRSLP